MKQIFKYSRNDSRNLLLMLMFLASNLAILNLNSQAIAQSTTTTPQIPPKQRPAIANERDQKLIHALVKTSLIAVNQGNLTGNYSVLRDLGNAAFLQKNTSADLAVLFASFRRNNIDFSNIVELTPIFTQVPIITEQNIVRTTGYFPTTPNLQFDIIYQLVGNRYRIDSISVGTPKSN